MKKIISLFLILLIVLSFTACGGTNSGGISLGGKVKLEDTAGYVKGEVEGGNYLDELNEPYYDENGNYNPTVLGIFYRNTLGIDISANDETSKEIDKKADEMLKKIEDYPDTLKAADGNKTYYVSAEGNDANDGLTPQTPKKTYMSFVNQLEKGDVILFRRGDVFRGQISLRPGLSYGAYGSGIKPRFYGSIDGKDGEWKETGTKGVYTFNKAVQCCKVVLDHGKAISKPVYSLSDVTKAPYNVYFNGSKVTMYCPEGNPKDVFKSIEISDNYTVLQASNPEGGWVSDIKLQNLCVMYAGVYSTNGYHENIEIEGCIMGYPGGRDSYISRTTISLGNCVEFHGRGVNCYVHDNYFFQAYDAAVSHQGPVGSNVVKQNGVKYENIHYEDNLMEYCVYGIEAFSSRSVKQQQECKEKFPDATWDYDDVYCKGNIIRYTGWSWSSPTRTDKNVYADFKYDAQGEQDTNIHRKPLIIENNILYGTRKTVFGIQSPESNKANMIMKNNLVVANKNAVVYEGLKITEDFENALKKYFGTYEGNKFELLK